MSTKTNETKTNATKTNATATEILTVAQLKQSFIDCNLLPKFTDNTHYVGVGVRSNVFSVNALKTRYNVYCSDEVFATVDGAKIKNVTCLSGANSTDKTRPNTIEVATTDALTTVLKLVSKSFEQYRLTTAK